MRKSALNVDFSRIWKLRNIGSIRTKAVTLLGNLTIWSQNFLRLNLKRIHRLVTIGIWIILCCEGLSCKLWVVYEHSCPLPTRCQGCPCCSCDNQKDFQTSLKSLWGTKAPPIVNHWKELDLISKLHTPYFYRCSYEKSTERSQSPSSHSERALALMKFSMKWDKMRKIIMI